MEAEAGRETEDKEEVAGVELAGNAAFKQLQRPGEEEAEDIWVACAALTCHRGGHPAPEARRRPGMLAGAGTVPGTRGLGRERRTADGRAREAGERQGEQKPEVEGVSEERAAKPHSERIC